MKLIPIILQANVLYERDASEQTGTGLIPFVILIAIIGVIVFVLIKFLKRKTGTVSVSANKEQSALFKGDTTSILKSKKTKEELISLLEEEFMEIGSTDISDNGQININATKFGSQFHKSTISGNIKDKNEEKYLISFNYTSTFTTLGWIMFVMTFVVLWCIFLYISLILGLLWLLFPAIAKNDIKKAIEKSLEKVRFEVK